MLWLVTFWSRIKAQVIVGAGIVLGVVVVLASVFAKGKRAGKSEAIQEQREVDDAARERIQEVKPADSAATVERLRRGRF